MRRVPSFCHHPAAQSLALRQSVQAGGESLPYSGLGRACLRARLSRSASLLVSLPIDKKACPSPPPPPREGSCS